MAKLMNTRRFLVEEGEPVVLGFIAIGDALIHANPITGRGCSLAWIAAYALAETLRKHPNDLRSLALELDATVRRELVPWYEMQVRQDRDAIEVSEAQRRGENPYEVVRADGTNNPKAFMRAVVREGLLPGLREDLVLMRAFMRTMNMLDSPNDLLRRPGLMQRVMACYERRHEREPIFQGPSREELKRVLAAAGAV
jgi:flavin-dependent dehydrogenase